MTNEEKIIDMLEMLYKGQQEQGRKLDQQSEAITQLQKGQQEQSEAITRLEQGQARSNTSFEALEAGVHHLVESSSTKRDVYELKLGQSEIKVSIQDLDAKTMNTLKRHQRRMDNAGLPDPDKH